MTPTQPELLQEETPAYTANGLVTCLGMTFADETARRAYFTQRLRAHLQDPAFRAIEGFPIGTDEDILALSDPPYYTACPNPFLPEIIADWSVSRTGSPTAAGRTTSPTYKREPFAADVSEGKNDPIYNAHSYHTKVPHKAIMRYILHYTEPGDIVFDGFCGTGMTGVAAQLCGDRAAVESLDPVSRTGSPTAAGRTTSPTYKIGARRAILNDLSPAATFIAYNYNTPVDAAAFAREATRILAEVEGELGWMWQTTHEGQECLVDSLVWSEVFVCPNCNSEIVFFDRAVDLETGLVDASFTCSTCGTEVVKRNLQRQLESQYDPVLGKVINVQKQVPVLVNFIYKRRRLSKRPDQNDLDRLIRSDGQTLPYFVPSTPLMFKGENWGDLERGYHVGISHAHHFYTKQSLITLSGFLERINHSALPKRLKLWFTSQVINLSKMNRYRPNVSFPYNPMSGTLYVGSQICASNPFTAYRNKMTKLAQALSGFREPGAVTISTQSSSFYAASQMRNIVDYVFIDPPFGDNLPYSELNFLWESWLKVFTNAKEEAIVSKTQKKGLYEYTELMQLCFSTAFNVLKPGHWMTVEFHNSKNSVWNAIQEAVTRAGFIIADVRTLDKGGRTKKQVSGKNAVKNDLVISAYKPTDDFQQRFLSHGGTAEGVWTFVRQHLAQVPVVVSDSRGQLETIAERQNFLLFDRMVAYHIQRGVAVPMGAAHFYAGLERSFVARDGMYFLPDQVAAYDKARLEAAGVAQLVLFVSDEKSALHWLRQQLAEQPHSFQEIQPRFLRELHQARHEELPDLRVLLEENFLQDASGRWYVPDPNRAEDLEKLRLRGLLREFETYKEGKKKLRQFRTEAMRAGFAAAWRAREYAVIVEVAERLPEQVLQEDEELVMYYDNARNRS